MRFRRGDLQHYHDATLRQLATSYGPLQIMGYNCLDMGVNIDRLKGEESLKYAMRWSARRYGQYLKDGDYRNAFHIHNTGQPHPKGVFPRTHHVYYVRDGMAYLRAFRWYHGMKEMH